MKIKNTTLWNSLPLNLCKENKKNFKYNLQAPLRNILKSEDNYNNIPEIITLLPKYKYKYSLCVLLACPHWDFNRDNK